MPLDQEWRLITIPMLRLNLSIARLPLKTPQCAEHRMLSEETTLSFLGGHSETTRLAVCLVYVPASGESKLRLREESFSPDVGWFIQGYVDLLPEQINALRNVLGKHAPSTRRSDFNSVMHSSNYRVADNECPAILKLPINRAG